MKHIYYPQEYESTCAQACSRTILFKNYGIEVSERRLIRISAGVNHNSELSKKEKKRIKKLLKEGTDLPDLENIAQHLNLVLLNKNLGNIDNLKSFIDIGLWPLVHRLAGDGEGHYIVACGYNGKLQIFDPDLLPVQRLEEDYLEFDRKWYYAPLNEKWFGVYVDPKKFLVDELRKYL